MKKRGEGVRSICGVSSSSSSNNYFGVDVARCSMKCTGRAPLSPMLGDSCVTHTHGRMSGFFFNICEFSIRVLYPGRSARHHFSYAKPYSAKRTSMQKS